MDTVIVSGANGFIGSAVIRALSFRCRKIYAIIKDQNENLSSLNGLDNVEIVFCELSDLKNLSSKIKDKADTFYHFAWIGVSGADHKSINAQLDNISYSVAALNEANSLECKNFVFASSVTEYECQKLMKSEKKPSPAYYYSACKSCAADICKILANEYGMNFFQAVITNIYGIGDYSNRFLNASLKKIIKGEPTEFTSGDQTYDFIYIDDAAEMLCRIPEKGVPNKRYYIGSGNPRPIKEFLYELEKVTQPKHPLGLGKITFNGISLDYAAEFDIHSTEKDLGYTPQTDFKEGILNTFNWLKTLD